MNIVRLIKWAVATLFVAGSLLFVCIPWWLRPVLETALSDTLQQPVHIQEIHIDPRSGLLLISGFHIGKHDMFGLRQLQLHVYWPALWDHRIDIVRLRLDSPTITVQQNQQGVRIAGFPIPQKPVKKPNDTKQNPPWVVRVQEINVQYANVHWQDSRLGQKSLRQNAELYLYWLHAERLDDGAYTIKADWQAEATLPNDGLAHAALHGKLRGVLSDPMALTIPEFSGNIQLQGMQADNYSMHLRSAALVWDVSTTTTASSIQLENHLTLEKTSLQFGQQEVTLDGLTWTGTVDWPQSTGEALIHGALTLAAMQLVADRYSTLSIQHSDWEGDILIPVGLPASHSVKMKAEVNLSHVVFSKQKQEITLDSLHWKGKTHLSKKSSMVAGVWRMRGLKAEEGEQQLSLNAITWDGILKEQKSAKETTRMAKGRWQINGIQAAVKQQNITVDRLMWDGLLKQVGRRNTMAGDWRMRKFQAQQNKQVIRLKKLHWQGSISGETDKNDALQLEGKQQLSLQDISRNAKDVQENLASLQWRSTWQVQVSPHKPVTIHTKANDLTVSKLSQNSDKDGILAISKTRWLGDLEATICPSETTTKSCVSSVKTQGLLRLSDLRIPLPRKQKITVDGIRWRGAGRVLLQEKSQTGGLHGDLSLRGIRLQTGKQTPTLKTIAFNGLDITAERTSTQQQLTLQLKQGVLTQASWPSLDEQTVFVRLDKALLSQLQIEAKQGVNTEAGPLHGQIQGEYLQITGLKAAWQRLAKGITKSVVNTPVSQSTPSSLPTDKTFPWQWRLGSFSLEGDNQLVLLDQHITPEWQATLSQINAHIGTIDSTRANIATPLQFSAQLSPAGSLLVKGSVIQKNIATGEPSGQANIQVKGVDAAPFSGYVEAVSGYALQRGTVNADLKATLSGSQLKCDLGLILRHLEIVPKNKTVVDTLQGLIGLSPDTALDTLRDSDDQIKLDIPIVGDLQSPDFHIEDVIQQALGGSLQKAAMVYLQYAFQPYGALLGAAVWVGEQAYAVHLPSIAFTLGSDQPAGGNYMPVLQKAAAFLSENPKASLALCGHAITQDGYSQIETSDSNTKENPPVVKDETWLLNLANQRAEFLIKQLQGPLNVPAEQLQRCRPTVTSEGKPQVELLI